MNQDEAAPAAVGPCAGCPMHITSGPLAPCCAAGECVEDIVDVLDAAENM